MTRLEHRVALAVALVSMGIGAGAARAATEADKVGVAGAVRGAVSVTSATATRKPASGEAMYLGDLVRTRSQSGLQLLLLDETTFTIGADCDLTIDRFVYDPMRSKGEIGATVTRGIVRYVSGLVSRDHPGAVTIRTPL